MGHGVELARLSEHGQCHDYTAILFSHVALCSNRKSGVFTISRTSLSTNSISTTPSCDILRTTRLTSSILPRFDDLHAFILAFLIQPFSD